jgi:hypothetical protein
LNNVTGIIYAESGKELELRTVSRFLLNDVMVIGEEDTNYTCEYINNYNNIIKITWKKSFIMDGCSEIWKFNCGEGHEDISLVLFLYNLISGADANFSHRYIEIIFLRNMNNFAYVEEGTICLEYVKIGNEINKWNCPIIYVACFVSSVTV